MVLDTFLFKEKVERLVSNSFTNFKKRFNDMPKTWLSEIPDFSYNFLEGVLSIQEDLMKYDLSIALARGGLWQSYVLNLLGLPMAIVDLKRKGKGATWKPLDNLEELSLKGKNLLVCDQDCKKGSTLRRAVRELTKYDLHSLGLFLLLEGFTIKNNIPEQFDKVYFPQYDRYYLEIYRRIYNKLKNE